MPRPVSSAILQAKKNGLKANLIHLALDTPYFFTDANMSIEHAGNTYQRNGLLQKVTPGSMTAGISANEWDVTLSAVDSAVYSSILAADYANRWVYHYVAYFSNDENGLTLVGTENRKFGQILRVEEYDDEETAEATFTMTSVLGNVERSKPFLTNPSSQFGRYGADDIFKFAHETDYKIPRQGTAGSYRSEGTSTQGLPNNPTQEY